MRTDVRLTNGAAYVGVLADPVPGEPVVTVAFLARDGTTLPTSPPSDLP